MYVLFRQQAVFADNCFFSALLVPTITVSAIGFCLLKEIQYLVISCVLALVYIAIIIYLWKSSHREEYFLTLKDDYVIIVYDDVIKGKLELTLSFDQIHALTYYQITSFKGWLLSLLTYRLPKSVYVQYTDGKNFDERFIGYLDYADVKKIADITNTKLNVY